MNHSLYTLTIAFFFGYSSSLTLLSHPPTAVETIQEQAQYLNKILHGYLKYGLPLWLTEFACADDWSLMNESDQAAYLSDAMKLLELHPSVARYAW